jgi:type VI secretion system secreted protein Hcp
MTVGIYLQLPGIAGIATERGHEDWIELTSASWGAGQAQSAGAGAGPAAGAGAGAGRAAGRSSQHPLIVTAPTTIATPLIFEAVTRGIHLAKAALDVVGASDGRGDVVIRWEFEDVRLMRFDIAGSAPGFDDSFELVSQRARLTVFEADPRGGAGQPVTRGWDFARHQPW